MRRILLLICLIIIVFPSWALAARGFGTTSGTAAGDVLTSGAAVAESTTRSLWVRFNLNAVNGVNAERIVEHGNTTFMSDISISAVAHIRFFAGWTTNGEWNIADPTTGVEHRLGITYNGGATTNNPIYYYDGTTPTVNTVAAPTGTIITGTDTVRVGNNAALNRNLNGIISEFAIWSVVLSAAEMTSLMAGESPQVIQAANLVSYWKICGKDTTEPNAVAGGTGLVVTGALYKDHTVSTCLPGKRQMGVGR